MINQQQSQIQKVPGTVITRPGVIMGALLMVVPFAPSAMGQTNISQSPVQIINGDLVYNAYANRCEQSTCNASTEPRTNRLRGYSYAGYRGGGVALPDASVGIRLRAGRGAGELIAGSPAAAARNHNIIQRALDTVDARTGRPRAVQLPAGRFFITAGLTMNRNGVVLRGAGQGSNGTVLVGTTPAGGQVDQVIRVGEVEGRTNVANSDLTSSASLSGGRVTRLGDGDWIKISNVQTRQVAGISMNYESNQNDRADYTLRVGSPTGEIVGHRSARTPVDSNTRGGLSSQLDAELSGVHDIYIVFSFASRNTFNFTVENISLRQPYRERGVRRRISQPFVVNGESKIRVERADSFSVGDRVIVAKTVNQDWIDYVRVNETLILPPRGNDSLWRETDYDMLHERTIAAVDGDEIELDAPIMDTIYEQFGGGFVTRIEPINRTSNVGIEDLRLETDVSPSGSSSHPESQTQNGINITFAENAWVDGVTCRTFVRNCVGLRNYARHVTVQDSAAFDWASRITGGRRYAFEARTSASSSLFQRLWVSDGRHDYVTGSQATGPIVFLDALAVRALSDIGPHHRYATGVLFDNIRGGELSVEHREGSGSGHGWSGVQVTYWKSDSRLANTNPSRRTADLGVESAPGTASFAIGSTADRTTIREGGRAFAVNSNSADPTLPRSLYLAELEDRLGRRAVNEVTISGQRTGQIYDALAAWRGEGPLRGGASLPVNTNTGSGTRVLPEDDTYIQFGSNRGTNFSMSGSNPNRRLLVKNAPRRNDLDRIAFVEFDLSSINRRGSRTVTLEMDVTGINRHSPGATRISVTANDSRNFREARVTANNQPTRQNSTFVGDLVVNSTGRVSVDVTEIMRTNTSDKIYFELRDDSSTNNLITFSSSEGRFAPRLTFE